MVVPDPENVLQGEVESSVQPDQPQNRNQAAAFASIGRQSSIYSLTLDEFQNTLVESGRNFGSMNMDEFLTSIWTAEENQAINGGSNNNGGNNCSININGSNNSHHHQLGLSDQITADKGIARQPSLTRQGSLTLPPPLCRKTVEEVWSDIHKGQAAPLPQPQQQTPDNNPEPAARQPTFGEMTLEDFLIKAGVVREGEGEGSVAAPPLPPPHPPYEMYHQNTSPQVGPSFVNRPAIGVIGGGGGGAAVVGAPAIPTYQTMPQASTSYGEASVYAGNGVRNGGFPPALTAPVPCYGGRVVNGGGGGYAAAQPLALPAPPMSPVSSDGICGSQVDNSGNQYGMDMVGIRGRKRIIDGPVEKVVERRQRRMIKNRESAARSRARKQAYTVELEAELNQLREENTQLKHALTERQRKRKQQYIEEMKIKIQTRAFKAKEKERGIRRNLSF